MIFSNRKLARACLSAGLAVLLLGTCNNARAQDPGVSAREEIIVLIEDKLSDAYSFSDASSHKVPHFEVLDDLFPKWHGGDPAVGRNFWLMAEYRAFIVYYRVDCVQLVNSLTAVAEGKKLVVWTKNDDAAVLDKLWPFQLWDRLNPARENKNSYMNAIYAMRYRMKLARNEAGSWYVVEETTRDIPNMENDLRVHCLFTEQLKKWGLNNTCRQSPLSMP